VLPRGESFVQLLVIPYHGGPLTGEARGIPARADRGIWGFGSTNAIAAVGTPASAASTSGTSAPAILSLTSSRNGDNASFSGGEMAE
jgi:hypothetical protein